MINETCQICGGCPFRELGEQEYRQRKQKDFEQTIGNIKGAHPVIENTIYIGDGNRRRAEMDFKLVKGKLCLGFNESKTHNLVDIENCPMLLPEINQLLPKSALQLLETTLMHLEALALRQAATQQLPVQQVRQLGIIRPHLREQVLQPEITQMLAAFTVPRQETKHRLQMIGAQQLALRLKHMGVEARLPDIRQLPLHPTVRLSARHQTQAG